MAEQRLIDMENVERLMKQLLSDAPYFMDHILRRLRKIPTVDAVPVVHGEWTIIEDDILMEAVYKCSACGEEFVTLDGEHPAEHLWNYCPNCGAKMDGGDKYGC